MEKLEGKTAVITGGASGIGLGIAKAFAQAGMNVSILDIRQDHIDDALEYFRAHGQLSRIQTIRGDVTDRDEMAQFAKNTESRFGDLHIAVNNAGVGVEGPLAEATFEDWDFALGVNLGGVINGMQEFVPRIRQHGCGGHIVNTASIAAFVAMPPRLTMYAAAKAAVVALSEACRGDLAQANIGVTLLCPGPVQSNIHEVTQNRPAHFQMGPSFSKSASMLQLRRCSPLWMDPLVVGELVLAAIRSKAFYVITHGEWRAALMSRVDEILAAMPEHTDAALIESLRMPAP